jgi:acetyl esterase/lipase
MNSFSRWCIACLVAVILTTTLVAKPPEQIPLWPAEAPGEKGDLGDEKDTTTPHDGSIGGKRIIRLGNVSHPTISIYRPSKRKDTGCAVLVCPGGGYHILAMDLEGTEVCEWFNSFGVTAVLLKYRVPTRKGQEKQLAPLQDAQRALSLVRHRASEWNIDPQRLGILGFSAGGHLSAVASTAGDKRSYEQVDDVERESCRPDFTMLIYPAYLTVKEQDYKLAPELNITAKSPPAFLVQTQDDGVGVANSFSYAQALQNAKVSVELHIYPTGGHGYGLRPSEKAVTQWPQRAEDWMKATGLLKRK